MFGQLDTFIAFAVVILGVSMLITVLNQMVTALLGLRGANLRWGLETLLEQVAPDLKDEARTISERVLQHPLISDSTWSKTHKWPVVGGLLGRWRLASAIKIGELVNILRKVAQDPTTTAQLRQQLTAFLATHDAQVTQRTQAATAAIGALTPQVIERIDAVLPHLAAKTRQATGDLELWFDSVMDRVSQRFALRMRLWTVVFSFIVAFTLHLDASVLLTAIRSDPELRAGLVASASAMTKQAEQVFGLSVTSIYQGAAERLKATTPELKDVPLPEPPLDTERKGAAWIAEKVTDETRRAAVLTEYRRLVAEEFKRFTGELGAMSGAIQEQLRKSGFTLVPDYGVHHPAGWPDWWPWADRPTGAPEWYKHLLGILATTALLCLGAPFWFQTLKTASGLRPVIASKEKEERAQRP